MRTRKVTTEAERLARRREDQRLLSRVLAGSEDGWSEFCDRFRNFIASRVNSLVRRHSVRLTAEGLDDLVGEVWVALLRDDCRKLRLYDADRGCSLTSWIGLIATNTTIDYLRVRHASHAYLEDRPSLVLVDRRSPDADLEQRQRAEIARTAVSRLREDEQRFVRYCFQDDWQPQAIADALGISVNTVHSRKFKLRRKLTQMVAKLSPAAA